jgi:hypothetical protein
MNVRRPTRPQASPKPTAPRQQPEPEPEQEDDPLAQWRPEPGTPKWMLTEDGLISRKPFEKARTPIEARRDLMWSFCWCVFWMCIYIPCILNDLDRPDEDRSLVGFLALASIPIICLIRRIYFYFTV